MLARSRRSACPAIKSALMTLLSYSALEKLCCKGRANTKRSDEIERAAGLSGNELRKLVNRMRRRGVPIGSNRSGYFYAVTAGEVYSTIRQLRRMANGLEAAIAGLEGSLDAFGREEV